MALVPNTMFECISRWLQSHSTSVERVENELRFKHSEVKSSLLVLKEEWRDGLIPVKSELLCGFFDGCLAASIGNGHLIIGSPVEGGIDVSHGYRIPDLNEIRFRAANFGMGKAIASEAFMIEASWMFLYGVDFNKNRLIRFDRDFGTYESLSSIENILDDWWQLSIDR